MLIKPQNSNIAYNHRNWFFVHVLHILTLPTQLVMASPWFDWARKHNGRQTSVHFSLSSHFYHMEFILIVPSTCRMVLQMGFAFMLPSWASQRQLLMLHRTHIPTQHQCSPHMSFNPWKQIDTLKTDIPAILAVVEFRYFGAAAAAYARAV